ncbi:hypothetical protein AB1Y20_018093 [Prymnesium parvum]|uniref:RNA helicase n=1 Tax=Prymnesium parvum TaxID=97485 RepID=A0AB34JPZ0_PRYPA
MAWRLGETALKAKAEAAAAAEDALPPVARDFYVEHPAVAALSPAHVEQLRAQLGIRVIGADCPRPVGSLLQASFPQYVLDAVEAAGYTHPTAVQRQAWPIIMKGRDLVALAETGSGKTLAFLLPALVHVNAQPVLREGEGPLALVLAPTRELAVQIHEESVRFGHPCGVSSVCLHGGVPKAPQVLALRKAPEVVVATPGRLTELLAKKKTELSRCTYVVVDEADRMLDLGFVPQLRGLLQQMRPDRQTLMFSATWPAEVQALASTFLLPGFLLLEVGGALVHAGKANTQIAQHVLVCSEPAKLGKLVGLLEALMDGSKILIFCNSKRRCDSLTRELRVDGWPCLAIHGDKSQEERDWVLQEFKDGRQPVLAATDVAQRGLDIKDIKYVINYDCPGTSEGYVHRIGRTGRAGASGCAYTLVTPEDARVAPDLVEVLRGSGQEVPSELAQLANAARYKSPAIPRN